MINYNNIQEVKPQKIYEEYEKIITYTWRIYKGCQLKCPYCCAHDYNLYDKSILDKKDGNWKYTILRLKTLKQKFMVEVEGGEPTLHPDIIDIVKELSSIEYCTKIEIHSNMVSDISLYMKLQGIPKVKVIASYHNWKDSNIIYPSKIAELQKYIDIDTNINMDPNKHNWDKLVLLFDSLIEYNVPLHLNFLYDTGKFTVLYTEEFYDIFSKYLTEEINPKILHIINGKEILISEKEIHDNISYKGFKCYQRHFFIEDNKIINSCNNETINNMNLNNTIKVIKCPLQKCTTPKKYFYKKLKDNNENITKTN